MKRFLFQFLILVCPATSIWAQPFTIEQRVKICSKVDSLLDIYFTYSNLQGPKDNKPSFASFNTYRKLFAENARIFDDMLPDLDSTTALVPGQSAYRLVTRDKADYFDQLLDRFLKFAPTIRYENVNIGYSEIDAGKVHVAVSRVIDAIDIEDYHYENRSSLILDLNVNKNLNILIEGIREYSSRFRVLNDDDQDGVINDLDKRCRDEMGLKKNGGCPDGDNDGVIDREDQCKSDSGDVKNGGCPNSTFAYRFVVSASVGLFANQHALVLPDLSATGYDDETRQIDFSQSNKGRITENGGLRFSPSLSGHLSYFFGRKKYNLKTGISVGVMLSNFSALYKVDGIVFQYKSNDSENDYRRIVTMKPGNSERYNFSVVNIPVMLRYKNMFRQKWAMELGAGVSYLSIVAGKSPDLDVAFDYEGIYHIDEQGDISYERSLTNSSGDLNLTAAEIISYGGNPGELYENLNSINSGYDFALNKSVDPKNIVAPKTRTGLGLNGSADLMYHLRYNMAIRMGFVALFGKLRNSATKDSYIMTDRTDDPYNSYYNAKTLSNYVMFGLNFGLVFGI